MDIVPGTRRPAARGHTRAAVAPATATLGPALTEPSPGSARPEPVARRTEQDPPIGRDDDGERAAGTRPAGRTGVRSGGRTRLVGIDAARGVAVLGMLVVNARIGAEGDELNLVWRSAHGRASLLFVLLAGVGVTLLVGGRSSGRTARMTLGWRALLLLPAGLLLDQLDHGATVILPTYSALFLLALVLVALPSRWLAVVVGAVVALGPATLLAVHAARGEAYEREGVSLGRSAGDLLDNLAVSGAYPLVTWTAPFALGILLGRTDLRARRVQLRLVVAGTVATVAGLGAAAVLGRLAGPPTTTAGPDHLVVATAHSQMPLWLVSGTGAALAVTGLLLLAGSAVPRLLHPLVATGQVALTVYVGHLVVLHLVGPAADGAPATEVTVAGVTASLGLLLVLGAVVGAVLWRAFLPYGPLEAALRPPWAWAASAGGARPTTARLRRPASP